MFFILYLLLYSWYVEALVMIKNEVWFRYRQLGSGICQVEYKGFRANLRNHNLRPYPFIMFSSGSETSLISEITLVRQHTMLENTSWTEKCMSPSLTNFYHYCSPELSVPCYALERTKCHKLCFCCFPLRPSPIVSNMLYPLKME